MSRVTEALREARIAAGLSQQAVAQALGISQAFVSDIEHGRRELSEKHYQNLPPTIRLAVVSAWLTSLREEMARARQMMRDMRKDGDTSG